MATIPFVCQKCGSNRFKTGREVKTIEDLYGATCENCSTSLTEDNIKEQALKIADDAARKAFKTIKL